MNFILFDNEKWQTLLPLTFTRPISEIRIGIMTISEKWRFVQPGDYSFFTQPYLQEKFKLHVENDNILINASILPNSDLIASIGSLKPGQKLVSSAEIIAARVTRSQVEQGLESLLNMETVECNHNYVSISLPWDIFTYNEIALKYDFDLITKGRTSQKIDKSNRVLGEENIFIEEGAKVFCSILNATTGPIYVGKDAEIMEGSIVRGALAMCDHSALKLGAKIYGATTLGPHCKVGGEVNNSVLFGYSSKAHDGFLGNSVLGEWCNLGADTNNSNLKNNYAEVKVWSYKKSGFVKTGLQFCGLIMGDHSKSGINTMFNTGTVVGVNANIFGDGFPRNFIPSFSWGGAAGFQEYPIKTAIEVAQKVYQRRAIELHETDEAILNHIFEIESQYRKF